MRTLRNNRVTIGVAALVVAIIAFIGLFVRAYNHVDTSAAPTFGPTTNPVDVPSASSDASSSVAAKPKASRKPTGDLATYTFPNGTSYAGGDTAFFHFQTQHIVVLRVFSSGNVQLIRVAWLAPESYDAPYGDVRRLVSPWSLTLHSSGKTYHAALFVGTDASANPVTCEIYIDGVLKDRKTARYPFARQVCIA